MTSFGVAGAGGVGKYLSEIIVEGEATNYLPFVDIKRYSRYQNGAHYLQERGSEVIG